MSWFIGSNGDYIGQAASKSAFEAQGYGYQAGPFPTAKAAQDWLNSHSGSKSGGWYVVAEQVGTGKVTLTTYAVSQKPFPAGATEFSGPYATEAEATAALNKQKNKAGSAPHVPNPLTGLAAIGDFFSKLGEASTWIRVAEVLLGLGLIVVGLAKIASGTAVGKAAVKVGETAAIL